MSWDDDKQDIKGEFKVRRVAPQERPRVVVHPKKEMGTAKFFTMVGLGVLGLFVLNSMDATPTHKPQTRSARDTPIHQTTHATSSASPFSASSVKGNYAQMAAKAKRIIARREAFYAAHPYPIKHWWVYEFGTYTCRSADTLPPVFQTPMRARVWMKLHGYAGRLQVFGREGDGTGVNVFVHKRSDLHSAGMDYFSKQSGCSLFETEARLTAGVHGLLQDGGDK